MNLNDILSTWNSPANRPTPNVAVQLKDELARRLRRNRRVEMAWLTWTGLLLTGLTILAARWVFFSGEFNLSTDWVLLLLLGAVWLVAAVFLRRFFASRKSTAAANGSIADALRATLADNRAAQARHKAIGALQLAFALILPLLIHQLHTAGKASPRELVCMAVFFVGALAAAGGLVAFKFFRVLRPQEQQIEALLRSYE